MEYPKRKRNRLINYDYNRPGYYFITICTKNKEKMLCSINESALNGEPHQQYTQCGKSVKRRIDIMCDYYADIKVDKYVVMPNHIHLILQIPGNTPDGPSGMPVPTNTRVSRFVGTFKRLCNREIGCNIWQNRFYDHIIRNECDYTQIWNYIEGNPSKWIEDCFYIP